jgi:ABC-type multidrug transport system fused ATPase/permease subunit
LRADQQHVSRNTPSATGTGLRALYASFWRFAAGKRLAILGSSTLLVASQLLKLAIPYLAGQAINTLQLGGTDNLHRAGLWIAAVLGVVLLSWLMHGPGRVIERSVGIRVRQNVSDALYAKLAHLPLAWHESHHSGETLHRVDKTTFALYEFAQTQFIYLQNFVNLAGPLAALALISRPLGAAALVGYLIIAAVVIQFDRILGRYFAAENEAERRFSAALVDFLGNIYTVLSLRLQEVTRRMMRARLDAVFAPLKHSIVLNEGKWAAVDLLGISLSWGLVALYAWLANRSGGALLIGNLFMVYQYTQQAGAVIGSIAANYQQFARVRIDFASADPIWHAPERRVHAGEIPASWRDIEVQNLVVRYSRAHQDRPSLDRVALHMRRGERIALIGPSGAGKSTLLRVLGGLYDADQGLIVVDGIAHPRLRTLGEIATLIPQDAEVFEASVRENLTFGVPTSEAMLTHAIGLAAFDSVVDTLPRGLDTEISERGLNLSGGQKQRLALARGILVAAQSSLVLLDEPTSNLDAVTEARIFGAVLAAFPEACIIASVHRLNLLGYFDRAVLMEAGRVVDVGTADDLSRRQPLFRELARRAAGEVDLPELLEGTTPRSAA